MNRSLKWIFPHGIALEAFEMYTGVSIRSIHIPYSTMKQWLVITLYCISKKRVVADRAVLNDIM